MAQAVAAAGVRRDAAYLVLISLCALLVGVPLLQGKLTSGHDAGEYNVRLAEFERVFRDGDLFPRWAPDVDFGYGSPIFVFLPPLVYYLALIPRVLGADPINALNITGLCLIILSGAGMYLFARTLYTGEGALLAGLAYLCAPFFLVTLYVRHAFTDFAALALLPFCFWSLLRLLRPGGRVYFTLGAISTALLVLSSYSLALITLPALILFVVLSTILSGRLHALAPVFLAPVLGMLISAAAWLPAIVERGMVHSERLLQGENYFYANHFVYLSQLLFSPWGYGVSVAGLADGFSFAVGFAPLLLVALGLLAAWQSPSRALVLAMLAVWVFACLMCLDTARPLWDALSVLQYLQFPWRYLALAAFAFSALAGAATYLARTAPTRLGVAVMGALLLLSEQLPHARPEQLYSASASEFSPVVIAARNLLATDADEYQPVQVRQAPTKPAVTKLEPLEPSLTVQEASIQSEKYQWRLDAQAETRARINVFAYPMWRAYVDGSATAIDSEPNSGLMLVTLPAGEHVLMLRVEETGDQLLGKWLSLLGVLACVTTMLSGLIDPLWRRW